jgi:hypothetical protein
MSCPNGLKHFLFSGAASLAALYRDRLKERGRGRPLPQQCAEGRPNQLVGGEELMGGAEPSLPAHLVGLGLSCCQAPASLGQIWDLHKSVGAGLWIWNDLFRIRLWIRILLLRKFRLRLRIRLRIRQKVSDPTGSGSDSVSGSTTLGRWIGYSPCQQ